MDLRRGWLRTRRNETGYAMKTCVMIKFVVSFWVMAPMVALPETSGWGERSDAWFPGLALNDSRFSISAPTMCKITSGTKNKKERIGNVLFEMRRSVG